MLRLVDCGKAAVAVVLVLVLAASLSGAAGVSVGSGRLSVEGFVHVQWVSEFADAAAPEYGFNLRRGRLKFQYDLAEVLRTEIELGCDELDLTVKDAFIEYRPWPCAGIVAGLGKMPFSREELESIDKLLTIERSETNDAFGDRGYLGRDIGLAVTGDLFSGRLPVGYAVGVFNGRGTTSFRDDNNAKQFVERLTFEPWHPLTFGVNATQRNDSLTGRLNSAYGGDIVCRFGPARIEAEVLAGDGASDGRMLGAHVVGAWRFKNLEPVVRFERVYPDIGQPASRRTLATAGLNWRLFRQVQVELNATADFRTGLGPQALAVVQLQAGF